jgi:amino acid transporter
MTLRQAVAQAAVDPDTTPLSTMAAPETHRAATTVVTALLVLLAVAVVAVATPQVVAMVLGEMSAAMEERAATFLRSVANRQAPLITVAAVVAGEKPQGEQAVSVVAVTALVTRQRLAPQTRVAAVVVQEELLAQVALALS